MNHIVKPFRPYFNTPLDPHRTQGMIAYYDATTQQGGGYLADKVGNRHGVFVNNPTWDSGNAVKTDGFSSYIIAPIKLIAYPITVSAIVSFNSFDNDSALSFRIDGTPYTWSSDGSTLVNTGHSSFLSAFPLNAISINQYYHVVAVYNSSTSHIIYVNGKNVTIEGNDYWNHLDNFYIGSRETSSVSRYSRISLKQLAIYESRALSQGEITEHYQDPYYFYERPKIYGFIASSGGNSLPTIINNYRQQGVM